MLLIQNNSDGCNIVMRYIYLSLVKTGLFLPGASTSSFWWPIPILVLAVVLIATG